MISLDNRKSLSELLNANLDAIVWPINTYGVFSSAVDLDFLQKFPDNGKKVVAAARSGSLVQGVLFVTKESDGKYILNAPLRRHPSDKLGYPLLSSLLLDLKSFLASEKGSVLETLGIPLLGCSSPDTLDSWEVENIYRLNLISIPQMVFLFDPN